MQAEGFNQQRLLRSSWYVETLPRVAKGMFARWRAACARRRSCAAPSMRKREGVGDNVNQAVDRVAGRSAASTVSQAPTSRQRRCFKQALRTLRTKPTRPGAPHPSAAPRRVAKARAARYRPKHPGPRQAGQRGYRKKSQLRSRSCRNGNKQVVAGLGYLEGWY